MNKEEVKLYEDKLLFRDTGVVFTLKGGIFSIILDHDFNETDSPDSKQIIIFLDEMHFDIHAKSKSFRDKNLKKNFYNKRVLLGSDLQKGIFLSVNPDEICNRLRLIIQEKRAGNDANRFDSGVIPIVDKLLDYKCITRTQHKKHIKDYKII